MIPTGVIFCFDFITPDLPKASKGSIIFKDFIFRVRDGGALVLHLKAEATSQDRGHSGIHSQDTVTKTQRNHFLVLYSVFE